MLCSSQTHMLLCLDLLLRFHCRDSLILAERRAFAPVFDSPPWDPPSAFCSGCGRLPLLSSFCTFSWIWQWIREMYPVSLFLWCRWLGSPGGFFLSWWWVVISSFFPPPSSWTQTFFRANTFPKKDTRTYQLESRMIFCCCSSLNPSPPLLCLKQIWVLLMTEMLKWFFSAVEILLVDEPESRNGSKVKPVELPVMFRPEGGQQVDLFSTRRRSKDRSGLDLISYLHFNLCGISK